jgi:hypothetical protein
MKLKDYPQSRRNELVIQELKGELLIYDLATNKAYCLNETSALIWQLCDGSNSIAEIRQSISKKLKSAVTEDFIWLAIDQLKEENLLENSTAVKIEFNGLSRREVIRKVGLASVVALPLISSLFAPTAAMAQSAGAGGGALRSACTTDANCSQGTCRTGVVGSYCCTGSPNSVGSEGLGVGSCLNTTAICQSQCQTLGQTECCDGRGEAVAIVANSWYSCVCSF